MIDLEQFNVRLGNNTAIIQQVMKMFVDQYADQPDLLRGPFSLVIPMHYSILLTQSKVR